MKLLEIIEKAMFVTIFIVMILIFCVLIAYSANAQECYTIFNDNTGDSWFYIGSDGWPQQNWLAFIFSTTTDSYLSKVSLYFDNSLSEGDRHCYIKLQGISNEKPDGNDLASQDFYSDSLITYPNPHIFSFDEPYKMTADVDYALVLGCDVYYCEEGCLIQLLVSYGYPEGSFCESYDSGSNWSCPYSNAFVSLIEDCEEKENENGNGILFDWSATNTTALIGWIGQVWTDLYIPILLALGVSLGFIILRKIIGLTKGGAR